MIVVTDGFKQPAGFIRLHERHRVKAQLSVTNAEHRRCRITKIKLK